MMPGNIKEKLRYSKRRGALSSKFLKKIRRTQKAHTANNAGFLVTELKEEESNFGKTLELDPEFEMTTTEHSPLDHSSDAESFSSENSSKIISKDENLDGNIINRDSLILEMISHEKKRLLTGGENNFASLDNQLLEMDSSTFEISEGSSPCKDQKKRSDDSYESDATNINSEATVKSVNPFHFELVSDQKFLLHLEPNTCVHFHGIMHVKVMKGQADILGWDLNEGDSEPVFSPRGNSLIGIRTTGQQCILELSPLESNLATVLNKLMPVLLFSGHRGRFERITPLADTKKKAEDALKCRFIVPGDVTPAKLITTGGEDWEDAIRNVLYSASQETCSRTIITGGKGVGKSTLLRLLLNKVLSRQKIQKTSRGALVLDFDLGQSEFTPPGSLAVVLVKYPLLGPGYTHQTQPERMIYLGSVDVSQCTTLYRDALADLVAFSIHNYPNVPWFINTMGFNTGLGETIMKEILTQIALPSTRVLDLKCSAANRNFHPNVWSLSLQGAFAYHSITSMAERGSNPKANEARWGLPPPTLREISTIAYFSPLLQPPNFSLLSQDPYTSHLKNLTLGVLYESVAPSQILVALNGSLIALCKLPTDSTAKILVPGDEMWPKIICHPPALPCFGYGVVCGVDRTNMLVFIRTPEPIKRMAEVNCLLMGNLELPLTLRVTGARGHTPYMSERSSQPTGGPTRKYFRPPRQLYPHHKR